MSTSQWHATYLLELLVVMSAGGRITRKVKQGKVEVDYEDSALLVHYDLEMVSSQIFRDIFAHCSTD